MNPNTASWEKGDFTEIAAFMRESGEAVVKSIGITPPLRTLDLGCGDGTTAMPPALWGPKSQESTSSETLWSQSRVAASTHRTRARTVALPSLPPS
jgi:hypothetical protein